jgi:phosphatidylserine/phosphatidylglycerophosphate/cardiolipin synthase-like enzyme
VTTNASWVSEAVRLFRADCTRTKYAPKTETFVVSPANSRKVLGTFLKRAKKELLIYDPSISDKEMIRILQERAKAGVKIKVIGKVAGSVPFEVQKLNGTRLHTRTIVRDRHRAFVGSQSLRTAELDSRRELGLIIQDAKAVKKLVDTFETDWAPHAKRKRPPQRKSRTLPKMRRRRFQKRKQRRRFRSSRRNWIHSQLV